MNGPFLVVDLGPCSRQLTNLFMGSAARLIGPMQMFVDTVIAVYQGQHNQRPDEDVLLDNFINGGMIELNPLQQQSAHDAVMAGVQIFYTLSNVHGQIYPGHIRHVTINLAYWLLYVEYGGENDQA